MFLLLLAKQKKFCNTILFVDGCAYYFMIHFWVNVQKNKKPNHLFH